MIKVNQNFWKGKRVFITGFSGFKGSWLCIWLEKMEANIFGVSLAPNTTPSLYNLLYPNSYRSLIYGDISYYDKLSSYVEEVKPEIIIHMAAQPLVRYSYLNPIETYSTNIMGTINVLEVARKSKSVKVLINVTSDKCYENFERIDGYKEDDPMGGFDPYSSSKGCSELITRAYENSYFKKLNKGIASVRSGNVIGGGDWSQDRLIPDFLKSLEKNSSVLIRNPNSVRPWQHVLEPLSGYLVLAEKIFENYNDFSGAWNFGPKNKDSKSVRWIIEYLSKLWENDSSWKIDSNDHPHETKHLTLDCSKANNYLGWEPKLTLELALNMIFEWHKAFNLNSNMKLFTLQQIENYENLNFE